MIKNTRQDKGGEMIALSNGVEVKVGRAGRIVWASDWAALVLDEINGKLSEVRSAFHQSLWGHTDYFLRTAEGGR